MELELNTNSRQVLNLYSSKSLKLLEMKASENHFSSSNDVLENKHRLGTNSYYLLEKSKKLQLNIDGNVTEPLIQSQDKPTKYCTASETENYANEPLAFKIIFWRS